LVITEHSAESPGSDCNTMSVMAALFGLAGFEVLAAADAGGQLELLVQTIADPGRVPGV
jgi:hypothetical protein